MSAKSALHRFDGFAKTLDDFRIRTKSGGLLTVIAGALILLLLVSEWIEYMTPVRESRLLVDSARKAKMDIYFNITLPKIPCVLLSLDVMDVAGEHHDLNDLSHDIYKVRLDASGKPVVDAVPEKGKVGGALKAADLEKVKKEGAAAKDAAKVEKKCGSCYGADAPAGSGGCCYTCKDIEDAYARKGWSFTGVENMEQCVREGYVDKLKAQEAEGCNLHGHLSVNKVAGNFHFAPGRSFEQGQGHIHDMMALLNRQFDFTHEIHYLRFGPPVPGMPPNPLDGTQLNVLNGHSHLVQYFLKVVGTDYHHLNQSITKTNQYSVTEHARDVSGPGGISHVALPGLFFNFDISPMRVVMVETRKSFMTFLTSVCAVVGGVITVASMIDAAVYRTERALARKIELGKVN
ncbi:endoplasmic reticulum vesicle transporter-domain-containing protein [Catenaria anguillulae PL171]|uniref:Endoplasmic reticulum vesicle transporter-domain-containing protein n=1 Tax=Catenaria anguillulae PL171 TaxID=765915 RepID=A0A1Y2HW71_9FUNG|nr:endoplasmic reticulum vesicle transporter-domain-containing protein [Catenaria anguillulae PL171]